MFRKDSAYTGHGQQWDHIYASEGYRNGCAYGIHCIHKNPILDADLGKNYVFVTDYDMDFPLITHVIKEFCETYPEGEAKLVLYIFENAETVFEKIMDELEKYEDTDCRIQIIDGKHVDIKAVLDYTDAYITNRAKNNIKLVDFARRYGKKIVSGCSYPILF